MKCSFKNNDLCAFSNSRVSSMVQFIERVLLYTLS